MKTDRYEIWHRARCRFLGGWQRHSVLHTKREAMRVIKEARRQYGQAAEYRLDIVYRKTIAS